MNVWEGIQRVGPSVVDVLHVLNVRASPQPFKHLKHLKRLKHLKDWVRAQANCFKCFKCFKCLGGGPWLEPETNLLNVSNVWASPQISKHFIHLTHLKHLKPLGP